MEDHETRQKVIRQWMFLPKDKRHRMDLPVKTSRLNLQSALSGQ
jgi:hypothetical protein